MHTVGSGMALAVWNQNVSDPSLAPGKLETSHKLLGLRHHTEKALLPLSQMPRGIPRERGSRHTMADASSRQTLPRLLTWSFLWSNDFPLVLRTLNSSIWRKTSRGAATTLLVIILTWWLLLQNQKAATET